jgi:2-polyprenyl-3-methyl-5-hydroxy-6-metoxy-1,4-benzoquinol methylase
MPSRAYHESLWESVPNGIAPAFLRQREAFLLREVAAARERLSGSSATHGGVVPVAAEKDGADRSLRALDVGCGEGHFAAALTRACVEVVAIDVAAEPLRRALERHPDLDARLVESEASLPLEDSSFDIVWAGETIEHVADTSQWLSELRRVLRSGGVLLLSTPDHGPLWRLRLALSRGAFEAHFDPRSDHLRFYTRPALATLLGDFGFEDVAVRGVGGVPGARRVLLASGRRRRF